MRLTAKVSNLATQAGEQGVTRNTTRVLFLVTFVSRRARKRALFATNSLPRTGEHSANKSEQTTNSKSTLCIQGRTPPNSTTIFQRCSTTDNQTPRKRTGSAG